MTLRTVSGNEGSVILVGDTGVREPHSSEPWCTRAEALQKRWAGSWESGRGPIREVTEANDEIDAYRRSISSCSRWFQGNQRRGSRRARRYVDRRV